MSSKTSKPMPKEGEYRTDRFVVFVYALVAVMFAAQVGIIVWGAVS